jgi:hypothetical protein
MRNKNKIDIEIDEDVKKSTTKCEKDFKCLVDNTHNLCKVKESVRDKILFIECLEENFCNYKMDFGYSYTCNCPTRKGIYKKYKI